MNKAQSYIFYAIAALIVFAVLLFRLSSDWGQEPLVQADGAVYLSDALFYPYLTNVLQTHNGALCLVSRSVAQVACLDNLHCIARYFRILSLCIASLVIAIPLLPLFLRRFPLTVRLMLVTLITLLPWEVVALGNITGLSCVMFCMVAFMTMGDYSRANIVELMVFAVLFLLAVLSTPYAGLAIPIVVWRYFRRRDLRTKIISGGMTALLVGSQVWLLFKLVSQGVSFSEPPLFPETLLCTVKAFSYNVVCMTAMGQQAAQLYCRSWFACYTAWILFFLFAVLCGRLYVGQRRSRIERGNIHFVFIASLYYVFSPLLFNALITSVRMHDFLLMDLYPDCCCSCFVSACFVLLIISLSLYVLVKSFQSLLVKCILVFVLCVYAVVIQRNFFYEPIGAGGWSQAVGQYRRDLADGMSGYDAYRVRLHTDAPVIVRLPLPTNMPVYYPGRDK